MLKCDVEGAEWFYTWDADLLSSVREMYIEVHRPPDAGKELKNRVHEIRDPITAQGFTILEEKVRMAFTAYHLRRETT